MQVSESFAEMMFKHGFVHCDPHAANLLVRPLPSSRKGILGELCLTFTHSNFHFSFMSQVIQIGSCPAPYRF